MSKQIPAVPLRKGDLAFVHVQKSAYNLHTGAYHWSRYHVIEVVSSDRLGNVKTYRDNPVTSAPTKTDRSVTVYSVPAGYESKARALFDRTALDSTGYETVQDLKAALGAAG